MPDAPRRSACPIVFALDLFGDRWTLLIIRDLMFKERRHYQDFLEAGEGISTNILADRLKKLVDARVITKSPDDQHGKRFVYRLSGAGVALAPVLLEMIAWSAKHDPGTVVPARFAKKIEMDRATIVEELRARLDLEH